jgi:iron complex outermembrane receptor protein
MLLRSPTSLIVAMLAGVAVVSQAGAGAQVAAPVGISVPAQPLASAISALAAQTDITIYAPSRLLKGKMSVAVSGAPNARAALDAMLKGAGLEISLSRNGTYILRQADRAVRPAAPTQAPDDARAVIVVVGAYSESVERALDIKREAASQADAVVASDIGKLPAVNVAEALQHLPGVTVSREAGEGEFVGVRGLGPNFQSVTFNGLPIAVNENIRNSDQSGRQFRFRVLPADLVGGVVVTKAPTADMVEGGIGANIDIRSVRPLERGAFASARVSAGLDERSSRLTPNGSLSGGWVNASDTLGLIGGISVQSRDVQFDRLQTFGYDHYDVPGVGTVEVMDGWNTTVEQERRQRLSFLGGLQWRPADDVELHAEILYAQFDNRIAENRLTYELGKHVVDRLVPGSARVRDGVLHAADIEGGKLYRNAEYSEQVHRNLTFILGGEAGLAGWTLSPTLSLSGATSNLDLPLQRIEAVTAEGASVSYGFDLGPDPVGRGEINRLEADLDLTDPSATAFRRYRIRPVNSEDHSVTLSLDAVRPLQASFAGLDWTEIQTGFQAGGRSRDYQRRDRMLTLKPGYAVGDGYYDYPVPGDAFDGLIGRRSLWAGPDLGAFREAFEVAGEYAGASPQADDLAPTSDDLRQSYRIEEDTLALYARLDFEGWVRDAPLTGNIGLRWADTDTRVLGTLVTARGAGAGGMETLSAPRVTHGSYQEFLPSLNLRLELAPDFVARFAASRSLTRPSLASLRDATVPSSATVSEIFELGQAALGDPDLDLNAVGGNPKLKPYVSTNVDGSLEWYFEEFGALTASVFYKRIEDFISGEARRETMPFAVRGGGAVALDVFVNRPQNIGDATLAGLELGYGVRTQSGLGLSASATITSSRLDLSLQNGGTQRARLQGASRLSYSITPFFERGPFEAYVSYTWRSEFESNGNVTIASDPRTDADDAIMAADFGTLDFGASYHFNDAVSLFAEGVNLTDARQAAYQGYEAKLYQLQQYGRTLNLGLRLDF